MSKPLIYLAGPMAGLSIEECNQWRVEVENQYFQFFYYLNPCRDKEGLKGTGPLGPLGYNTFMAGEQTVFHRDTNDVRRCDAILANFLDAHSVSIGTIFELGYGYAFNKPIVLVTHENSMYDHIFTRQCATYRAETLREGMRAIHSIFGKSWYG